jgi:hypothetical protein
LKPGDALSPLPLNFALECAISRVQANQEGLKINDASQLQVHAYNYKILGGKIHTLKKNKEVFVVVSNEIDL